MPLLTLATRKTVFISGPLFLFFQAAQHRKPTSISTEVGPIFITEKYYETVFNKYGSGSCFYNGNLTHDGDRAIRARRPDSPPCCHMHTSRRNLRCMGWEPLLFVDGDGGDREGESRVRENDRWRQRRADNYPGANRAQNYVTPTVTIANTQ
jgi:hypothetical protein